MLLAAGATRKARLQEKAQFRSSAAVAKKLPTGSGTLASLPARSDAKYDAGSAGDDQWEEDWKGGADGFSTAQRAQSTHDEHEDYMGRCAHWLHMNKFGEFVKWEKGASGKLELVPVRDDKGAPKVPKGAAIAAWLLDHAVGNLGIRIPSKDSSSHAGIHFCRRGLDHSSAADFQPLIS